MKLIRTCVLLIGIILSVHSALYAGFDLGIYAGYAFSGEVDSGSENMEPTGFQYGLIGHYNKEVLPMVLKLGIGPYIQYAPQSFEVASKEEDYTKTTIGFDVFAQIEIIPVIHPYARFSMALWEDVEAGSSDNSESFNTYTLGIGADFTLFALPAIFDVRMFGEYLYNFGEQDSNDVVGHSVNIGFRMTI